MRGTGDAYALRKAYHDEKVNNQFRPASPDGAAIFEAAEQARVEAIGALAMKGVAANLAAGLEQRLLNRGPGQGAQRATKRPLADVLGLMVREKLTGEKPPASVANAVDLWRPFIEDKAGSDLDKAGRRAARPEGLRPADPHHAQPSGAGRPERQRPDPDEDAEGENADGENDEGDDQDAPAGRRKRRHRIRRRSRGRRGGRSRRRRPSSPRTCRTPPSRKTAPSRSAMKRLSPIRTNGATRSSPPSSTRRSPPPIFASRKN